MTLGTNKNSEEDASDVFAAVYNALATATEVGGELAGMTLLHRNQKTTENSVTLDSAGLDYRLGETEGFQGRERGNPVVSLSVAVFSDDTPTERFAKKAVFRRIVVATIKPMRSQGIQGIESMEWETRVEEDASTDEGSVRVFDILTFAVMLPTAIISGA